jgi:AraC-like DNA-binding protein
MEALQEQVAVLRSPHLAGVEFVDVRNTDRCWTLFHESFDVCACDRADFDWVYRHRQHSMNGSGVGLAEPGEIHRNTAVRGPQDVKVVMLSPRLVADALSELELPPHLHFRRPLADDPALHRAIGLLGEQLATGADPLVLQTALTELLTLILAHGEKPRSDSGLTSHRLGIQRAVDHLQAHFEEAISLDELAKVAGLSRYHFAHAFRTDTGLPPHRYQLALRIGRAKTLLRGGMKSLDVALCVGFTDQSHFIRHFLRAVGTTPARYAR